MSPVRQALERLERRHGRGVVRAAYELIRRAMDEGDPEAAEKALAIARQLADSDPEGEAWLLLSEARLAWQAGQIDIALARHARGMAALEAAGDRRSLVLALLNDGGMRASAGRGGAERRIQRALDEAISLGDDELTARACFTRSFHAVRRGLHERAFLDARVGAWLARRAGHRVVEAMCLSQVAAALAQLGDRPGAAHAHRQALDGIAHLESSRLRADYLASYARVLAADGVLQRARVALAELDEDHRLHCTGRVALGRDMAEGLVALAEEDHARADIVLRGALQRAEALEEVPVVREVQLLLGRVALAQGRIDDARTTAVRLRSAPSGSVAAQAAVLQARADAALGDLESALTSIDASILQARRHRRHDIVREAHLAAAEALRRAWRHEDAGVHLQAAAAASEAHARLLTDLYRRADARLVELEDDRRVRERRTVPPPSHDDDEVGLILATLAHELRTPLSTIGLALDAVEEGIEPRRATHRARSAVHFLDELIDGLLSSYRSGSRQILWTAGGVPLVPMLREAVARHSSTAETKGITMELRVLQPVTVAADLLALREIIDNLLSNAVKFSDGDTTVVVRCGRDGTRGWLSVEDQGPGIPSGEQRYLFQRFRRLSPRPTAGEPSTGLGLYLVRTLVEQMDGRVQCRSVEGEGTTMRVTLDRVADRDG